MASCDGDLYQQSGDHGHSIPISLSNGRHGTQLDPSRLGHEQFWSRFSAWVVARWEAH